MRNGNFYNTIVVLTGFVLALAVPGRAVASVTLSPTSLTFGSQVQGTTSAAKTLTLTNIATSTLTITSIAVSGNFAHSGGTCPLSPNTLGKSASCTILITFKPTTLGSQKGNVTVTDTATNSPQTATLSGIGIAPVTVVPTSLQFAKLPVGQTSPAQTVTLTNNQSVALTFNNIATNSGDFAVAGTTCGSSIGALATCTAQVTFSPKATGKRTGTLSFSDSAANTPQTVSLTGTGAAAVLVSIAVTPPSSSVSVGATEQLTATGTYSNNITKDLTSSVAWTTSPTGIASVSAAGVLMGLAPGGTSVTATLTGVSGSATVTVNQSFVPAGSLNTARYFHSATMLDTGIALLAGGIGPVSGGVGALGELASAELYNPNTGTFTFTGNLNAPREGHTATLLNNGLVLIAGGSGGAGELQSAELFHPTGGTFSVTGKMFSARYEHTATLLPNGAVLIAGGYAGTTVLSGAELYDSSAGAFAQTGSLNAARFEAAATLLPNGLVLIAGGANATGPLASAELYDPTAKTFTLTGSLQTARSGATATLLNTGLVLIANGYNYNAGGALSSAELYDPTSGTFTPTGSLSQTNWLGTATLSTNGTVMTAGSVFNSAPAEIYSPFSGTFIPGSNLITPRDLQTATLLPTGAVLFAGGHSNMSNTVLASAELYAPSTLTPTNLVSIALSPANPSLRIGASQAFIATGTFSDNSTQQLQSAVWTSANPTVATVSSDATNSGVAFGLAAGSTMISACTGTVCGTTLLTVTGSAITTH
jgi:hypothetical protein